MWRLQKHGKQVLGSKYWFSNLVKIDCFGKLGRLGDLGCVHVNENRLKKPSPSEKPPP